MESSAPATLGAWTALPRGGYYVRTSRGPVQVGVPPETIKDVLALGLELPIAYVLPRELFDRRRGLSVAEFEFPAYYTYFVKKRRCRLVVLDADVEARARAIFQESLFGPAAAPPDHEFVSGYPEGKRPKFYEEGEYFRTLPGRGRIEVDDLVEFIRLDEGRATIDGDVEIELREGAFVVREGGRDLAAVGATVALPPRVGARDPDAEPASFFAPLFGVTVLGASHGFDPSGKTTGFLLWIGGRALLVDPPTDSTEYLNARGIAPKTIAGVILTHCHADHDAGTFQKLLEETQVDLYTTPHVLGSFLRKYSALSGLDEDVLRRTFSFHPVRIGAPVHVRGGELWFRYTLHSIPALGFDAFYGDRSISISGDTLYDPPRVREMFDRGVFGRQRYEELLDFPGHHTVILHEAGVPPLHTPTSALAELPDDVKRRMYLVHIAAKDVPEGVGLRAAREGLEHTIVVDASSPPRFGEAVELLDVFAMVDFLRDLPLSRARSLLHVARRVKLAAGEHVVTQGTRGDRFYIVERGVAEVVKDGASIRLYRAGDYFGELAVLLDQPRSADVIARTELELVAIDRNDFLTVLRGSEMLSRLERLMRVRDEGAWELFASNSVLGAMTCAQKTQLQTGLVAMTVAEGEVLWARGRSPERAFLLDDARVTLRAPGGELPPFGKGAFLAEEAALREGSPSPSEARARQAGKVFAITRADLLRFFDDNPGVYLSFIGARFVE